MNLTEKTVADRKIFCQQLQEKVKEKRITQKELEEKTGIKQGSISRMFNGEFAPRLDIILIICEAIGAELTLNSSAQNTDGEVGETVTEVQLKGK